MVISMKGQTLTKQNKKNSFNRVLYAFLFSIVMVNVWIKHIEKLNFPDIFCFFSFQGSIFN